MGPAAIPIALVAISTAMAAASQVQQVQAQKARARSESDAANYNAQVQQNNALVAGQNADLQTQLAEREAANIRLKTGRVLGQQQAALGKSGITNTGSALDVAEDTSISGALDASNAQYNGMIQAWNSRVNANNFNAGAGLDRSRAANAGVGIGSGLGLSLASTAIGGASSAYGSYSSANPSRPSFNSASYTRAGDSAAASRFSY